MEQLIQQYAASLTIPILCLGIVLGFGAGTLVQFLSYGIFKAISLVNINK